MFDFDYFIAKFEAIPESEWGRGSLNNGNRRCALGHCGTRSLIDVAAWTGEAKALVQLFKPFLYEMSYEPNGVIYVNDGGNELFNQKTPKLRILAALKYLKTLDKK